MQTTLVQATKLAVAATTGLTKNALHVLVGLFVYFAVMAVGRRSLQSALPWVAVLLAAVIGAALDMRDDLASLGSWRWRASLTWGRFRPTTGCTIRPINNRLSDTRATRL